MIPVKILYSQWIKYSPLEVYLEKPAMGEIYNVRGRLYVRFKAHIDIKGTLRQFDLNLPMKPVERAFLPLPVPDKNCKLLRIVMQKEDRGKLNILDWEVIE